MRLRRRSVRPRTRVRTLTLDASTGIGRQSAEVQDTLDDAAGMRGARDVGMGERGVGREPVGIIGDDDCLGSGAQHLDIVAGIARHEDRPLRQAVERTDMIDGAALGGRRGQTSR